MTPERWKQISQLYAAARGRPVSERAEFLSHACADDATMRLEVQSLLDQPTSPPELEGLSPSIVSQAIQAGSQSDLTGRQFGAYVVCERIGSGGMGEVFRARDIKLGRDVAIKVLPAVFANDADRLARLDREARILAALDHPHIGAIYGIEESEGTRALVLALVEGETLADRLTRGPIAMNEALEYARQTADALEAAHDKGIIHRDLKPANIKITPAGIVKVLDFGLAKAVAGPTDVAAPQSPTLTVSGTRGGVLLGTAAYMSPEQARGQTVDKRTDVWAFGCVLYEMLTGRVAFAGDTVSDTIAAVLEREPEWSHLQAPDPLRRVLHRCLTKDRNRRFHDIADARIEIEDALSGHASPLNENAVADPRQRSVRLMLPVAIGALLVALIAVGAVAWYQRTAPQAQPSPTRILRMRLATSGAATLGIGTGRNVAITPDGSRVIYVSTNNQLLVQPLDRLDATPVFTGVPPLGSVFVSPDSRWIGFVEGTALRKVALTGGPAATIVQTDPPFGATWAPDDTIIFASSDPTTGLRRISAGGGEMTVLTRPAPARGERDHLWPEMLPGGKAVLFTISAVTGGAEAAQVAVLDLMTGTYKVLVAGASHAQYVTSGHLVYASAGALRAVPFDLARLETSGTEVTVLPLVPTTLQGGGDFAVAGDGTLAYVDKSSAPAAAERTLVWVDRQGVEEPLKAPPRGYLQPRLSPDASRVAVTIEDQGMDIWLWDIRLRALNQFTFDPALDQSPEWTRDGVRILFFSQREGGEGLYWQTADGVGEAEKLGSGPPTGVTPDGSHVLATAPNVIDIMMLALTGGHRTQPLLQTGSAERNGVVSSNGRWLAYESNAAGQFDIYVRPFPNVSAGPWRISPAGGTRALWARSGQELFYVAPDGALMAVRVDARSDTWLAGSPARIIEGPYETRGLRGFRTYDVSDDGQRFLMVKQAPAALASAPHIVVVDNWHEELKRLVPVK